MSLNICNLFFKKNYYFHKISLVSSLFFIGLTLKSCGIGSGDEDVSDESKEQGSSSYAEDDAESRVINKITASLDLSIDKSVFFLQDDEYQISSVKGSLFKGSLFSCTSEDSDSDGTFDLSRDPNSNNSGPYSFLVNEGDYGCYLQIHSLKINDNIYTSDSDCIGSQIYWDNNSLCSMTAENSTLELKEIKIQSLSNISRDGPYGMAGEVKAQMILKVSLGL